jgi:hypothetical protein
LAFVPSLAEKRPDRVMAVMRFQFVPLPGMVRRPMVCRNGDSSGTSSFAFASRL